MKKIVIVYFIICLTNFCYAGFTAFQNGILYFSDGSGFTQESVIEIAETKEYIQLLDHGTDNLFMSKGIRFQASGSKLAQVYKIQPELIQIKLNSSAKANVIEVERGDSAKTMLVKAKIGSDADSSQTQSWIQTGRSTYLGTTLGLNNAINYCSANCDEADIVIGESLAEFIAFDFVRNNAWLDPSGGSTLNSPVISFYKAGVSGTTVSVNRTQALFQSNKQAVFIGKNSNKLTTLSLYPQFQYATGAYDTRIAINSDIPYEVITVDGNLKVAGNLTSTGEFGVFTQTLLPANNVDIYANSELGCSEFKVSLVPNNVIAFGSINNNRASSRHAIYELYFKLYYKRGGLSWSEFSYLPQANAASPGPINPKNVFNQSDNNLVVPADGFANQGVTIKSQSTRAFGGSWAQYQGSMVTQLIAHLPSSEKGLVGTNTDTKDTEYKLCLNWRRTSSNGSIKPSGDQVQISILGLPGSTLDGIPPGVTPPEPTLTLSQQGINSGQPDERLFTENFMSFRENSGRLAPALVGYSNYLIFSTGTDYTGLKASKIQANEFYEIFILKIIHEETPIGYNTDTGNYASGTTTPTDIRPLTLFHSSNNGIGFDVLKVKNEYSPISQMSPYARITSFNIGAYNNNQSAVLKIKEGAKFTNSNFISIKNEGSTTTQLSILGQKRDGFSLVSKGNISYSGAYEGTVGKMFQCQKYAHIASQRTVGNVSCSASDSSTAPVTLTINAADLATNSSSSGWRMIIYGSASFVPKNLMSINMQVTLANDSGVKINTKTCSSPCSSDQSTYKADGSANRSYQLNNFIVLEKVPPGQNISIKLNSSHSININAGNTANYGTGASISVIAFPMAL